MPEDDLILEYVDARGAWHRRAAGETLAAAIRFAKTSCTLDWRVVTGDEADVVAEGRGRAVYRAADVSRAPDGSLSSTRPSSTR